jgi:hypothetical protein
MKTSLSIANVSDPSGATSEAVESKGEVESHATGFLGPSGRREDDLTVVSERGGLDEVSAMRQE